jgi:acyl-CoA oxidase
MIGGWGLTENRVGSDASNLQTAVTPLGDDKYRIHGDKRWIGNGNRDLLIIWAKNTENKKVEGYIVENKNVTGLTSIPIKYKLPLRIVQNCNITLNNVVVSGEQKLPKATDWVAGTNVVLKHSRIYVCWVAAGIAMGVYDNAIRYISNRKQFGQQISGMSFTYRI